MKIKIVYFASLRDNLAASNEDLELPTSVSKISHLKKFLSLRGGKWAEQFDGSKKIKSSINYDLIQEDADLIDGAEVAFFPPVTGG